MKTETFFVRGHSIASKGMISYTTLMCGCQYFSFSFPSHKLPMAGPQLNWDQKRGFWTNSYKLLELKTPPLSSRNRAYVSCGDRTPRLSIFSGRRGPVFLNCKILRTDRKTCNPSRRSHFMLSRDSDRRQTNVGSGYKGVTMFLLFADFKYLSGGVNTGTIGALP